MYLEVLKVWIKFWFMQSIKFILLEREVKYGPGFLNPKTFLALWEEAKNNCLKSISF